MTLQSIALDILNGAQNLDAVIVDNKRIIADYFTDRVREGCVYGSSEIEEAVRLLSNVDANLFAIDHGI